MRFKNSSNIKTSQIIIWIGLFVLMVGFGVTATMLIDGIAASSSSNNAYVSSLSASDMTATQLCIAATSAAGEGDYVLMWEIFGTPTITPTRTGGAAAGTPAVDADIPTLTPTPAPTEVAFVGDVERGKAVFERVGNCAACHSVGTGSQASIGPDLRGIAVRAAEKLPGVSAATYLRTVILDPARIVPLSKPGVMPISYGSTLSTQQLNDVITYLLTLE